MKADQFLLFIESPKLEISSFSEGKTDALPENGQVLVPLNAEPKPILNNQPATKPQVVNEVRPSSSSSILPLTNKKGCIQRPNGTYFCPLFDLN
jgi:hypothetical protein